MLDNGVGMCGELFLIVMVYIVDNNIYKDIIKK